MAYKHEGFGVYGYKKREMSQKLWRRGNYLDFSRWKYKLLVLGGSGFIGSHVAQEE